jgi:AraC family transcriptional activator of tynA and feaB
MDPVLLPPIQRWSTDNVDPLRRCEYYADALSGAVTPVLLSAASPASFESTMAALLVGPLTVIQQKGTAHSVRRDPRANDRAAEHSYHVMVNLASRWNVTHRDELRMRPGEAMIVDSRLEYIIDLPETYEMAHIKLSPQWLHQWVPSPGKLVGRRIPAHTGWGNALTSFMAQLSPQFLHNAPLPVPVLMDQLGAMLALIAHEMEPPPNRPISREKTVRQRIRDCVAQRCTEPGLTASDVALSLNISVRTLHRSLATFNETFGVVMIFERASLAERMLKSPLFRRLSVAEIGRRAGFADASHFSRAFQRQYGQTPSQIRRKNAISLANADGDQDEVLASTVGDALPGIAAGDSSQPDAALRH